MCRIIERSGEHVYLMVCTLRYKDAQDKKKQDSERALGKVIEMTLRRGDAYTKYSENQFLILLSAVQSENLEVVYRRIEQGFLLENKNSDCWIEYSVTEIANVLSIDQLKNINV